MTKRIRQSCYNFLPRNIRQPILIITIYARQRLKMQSYSWFYHWYYGQITSYMDDGLQKDYYKECEYVALWFNRVRGNSVLPLFFKDNTDFNNWVEHYGGFKIILHYQYYKIIHYPMEADKETIIDIIIRALMQIYKNGDIPK